MSNDQSYLDSGQTRDVCVVEFDAEGNMSEVIVAGQASAYAEALEIVKAAGYKVAPEGAGYDIGHIATDGLDAYGIPVLL